MIRQVTSGVLTWNLRCVVLFLFSARLVSGQEISFECEMVNKAKFEDAIRWELEKYPTGLLRLYVQQIAVINDDRICGRAEVFSNRVVLSATCDDIRETIHHELSSFFLQLYDGRGKPALENPTLDSLYWEFLKLNGDYKYSYENGIYSNEVIDARLADRFYHFKYASRDFENDVNVISQCLFTNGSKVIEFMKSNPEKPVSRKIQLVMDFYHKVSPQFTTAYFRKQILN